MSENVLARKNKEVEEYKTKWLAKREELLEAKKTWMEVKETLREKEDEVYKKDKRCVFVSVRGRMYICYL